MLWLFKQYSKLADVVKVSYAYDISQESNRGNIQDIAGHRSHRLHKSNRNAVLTHLSSKGKV